MLDIDLIEARANAATPGPWSEAWDGEIHATSDDWELVLRVPEGDDRPADCAFVANAREDVPALIAEVRRLRAVVEAAMALCEQVERDSMMIDLQYLCRAVAVYKAQEGA